MFIACVTNVTDAARSWLECARVRIAQFEQVRRQGHARLEVREGDHRLAALGIDHRPAGEREGRLHELQSELPLGLLGRVAQSDAEAAPFARYRGCDGRL